MKKCCIISFWLFFQKAYSKKNLQVMFVKNLLFWIPLCPSNYTLTIIKMIQYTCPNTKYNLTFNKYTSYEKALYIMIVWNNIIYWSPDNFFLKLATKSGENSSKLIMLEILLQYFSLRNDWCFYTFPSLLINLEWGKRGTLCKFAINIQKMRKSY